MPQLGEVVAEKSQDGRGDLLVLQRPIKFRAVVDKQTESPNGWRRGAPPHITGEIEFGLHVAIEHEELEDKNMWHLRLGQKRAARLVKFACHDYSRCEEISEFLQQKFAPKVLHNVAVDGVAFEGSPLDDYKRPMAARQLIGVLRYINDFASRPTDTLHAMVNAEQEVVRLFFNCHADSVRDALAKEVPAGYFEASFYQNLLDNLGIPDAVEVDIEQLMKHRIIDHGDRRGPLHMIAQEVAAYGTQGLELKGQLSLSKDPVTLSKIDMGRV